MIDKPTREVNTSSTLLDNIYTNESESGNICTSGIMKTDFRDHYSIFSMSKSKTDNIVLRRDFSESNKAKFYKAMKNPKWDTIYKIESAQSPYEYFETVILELFENFFPLRKVRLKYSNKFPWVTKGLCISIKQKTLSAK